MKLKSILAVAAAVVAVASTGVAAAQQAETSRPVPRFARLAPVPGVQAAQAGVLATWTYNWTYAGTSYSAAVLGSAPSGAAATIPIFIIPIQLTVGGTVFSPSAVQSNGNTALANTLASPIFQSLDFVEAGTDLGTTQFIDALQRANFWSTASGNTGWHTLLGKPTVLPTVSITVPSNRGHIGSPFGITAAEVSINWLDAKFQAIIRKITKITPAAIPIFVTYDTYLTQGGCCIGGYHSAMGAQAYSHFTYIGTPGQFAEDVSALSHELAEIAMDPMTTNNSPCGILEVGDPLENTPNFGNYPYVLGGFTYHLQDEALITYFGAPANTSLASRTTFQGTPLTVCQNGS